MRFTSLLFTLLCYLPLPAQQSFLAEFNTEPDQPVSFLGSENWAVFLHSRDAQAQYQPYPSIADHGPNCEPPVRMTPADIHDTTHLVQTYEQMIYTCRNHLMTNIRADGYGLINFMPNHLVDFSEEEAVIRWDISTFNQTGQNRDWFTVTVVPLEDLNPLHAPDWAPDLEGASRNTLRIETGWVNGNRSFSLELRDDQYRKIELPVTSFTTLESLITPSKVNRTTFELRISDNRLRLGMKLPDDHPSGEEYHWWADAPYDRFGHPFRLPWSRGAVLFGHYSYNPRKDGTGMENTWHWDNIYISPSRPFPLIGADRRYADESHPRIRLNEPAPANARLLFAATDWERISDQIDLNFDAGNTWEHATRITGSETDLTNSWGTSYVTYSIDIPEGTRLITFRGSNSGIQNWMARDIYVIGRNDINTSVAQTGFAGSMEVYPNPFGDKLNVVWRSQHQGQIQLDLYDIAGKKLSCLYRGQAMQGQNIRIDAGSIPPGTYYLKSMGTKTEFVVPIVRLPKN